VCAFIACVQKCVHVCVLVYNFTSFPGNEKELNPPSSKKVYEEMIPYHKAYDNAKNKCKI